MFKKFKIRIGKGVWIATAAVVLFSLIGFVESRQSRTIFKEIDININHDDGNNFIDETDVHNLITEQGQDQVKGKRYCDLDLKTIEERLKSFMFIDDAQASRDHKGNLVIHVTQCKPIVRLMQQNGAHLYISNKSKLLPVSEKFTPRVLLVDGPYVKLLMEDRFLKGDTGKLYYELFKRIDQDRFWKAQIAQMSIDNDGNITIYPQVGNQIIYFGKPEDVEDKLLRLKVFYKKIVPAKGWNTYKTVNVKFRDQIICE